MLPTVNNPAVLELEDDAAANIQVLAVPLRAVVMNADHAAVVGLQRLVSRRSRWTLRPAPSQATETDAF